MKVAIIGLSEKCRSPVPDGWEKWRLAWDWELDADLVFEMHEPHQWPERHIERHLENWAVVGTPIMMHSPVPECPTSVVYPFDAVLRNLPDDFQCSIAYMIALAIARDAEEIGVWGVGGDEDYITQRPNLERWLGILDGRGIRYWIHPQSSLQKAIEPGRYGTGVHTGDKTTAIGRKINEMWRLG